jgi:hypothetical protein
MRLIEIPIFNWMIYVSERGNKQFDLELKHLEVKGKSGEVECKIKKE